MAKVTLDMNAFKALASDTRLDILKALDNKKMNLKDLSEATKLNKATLHEHLSKLNEAGLVKRKERNGHKWVYYKLTWKGESLLHPENTRIVLLFTMTFIALWGGIIQLMQYVKGTAINIGYDAYTYGEEVILTTQKSKSILSDYLTRTGGNISIAPGFDDEADQAVSDAIYHIGTATDGTANSYPSLPFSGNFSWLGTAKGSDGALPTSIPDNTQFVVDKSEGVIHAIYQDPTLLCIALGCFLIFAVLLCIALWRLWTNKTPKL